MKIDETNFIESIKNSNEKGIEYVIDNYSWILKTVIDKHLFYLESHKEECMNDCLLAIWENIDSYDRDRSDFKNWIAGIAKFKSIDYLRKYLKDLDERDIDDMVIIEEDKTTNILIREEFNREIRNMLKELSEEDEKIFKEFYFNDKSVDEISNITDINSSNIYNRLSRGRKRLRQVYNK